jgi:hypothetical protein
MHASTTRSSSRDHASLQVLLDDEPTPYSRRRVAASERLPLTRAVACRHSAHETFSVSAGASTQFCSSVFGCKAAELFRAFNLSVQEKMRKMHACQVVDCRPTWLALIRVSQGLYVAKPAEVPTYDALKLPGCLRLRDAARIDRRRSFWAL